LNREQKKKKKKKKRVEVADVALEMCQPLRLEHWPPKTSPWLHSSQSRVEIEFGIVESNQSLTPLGNNAEMTAGYLSLARWISDCYVGLLDDDGNCTGPVEDV
jgi:hypothetical protein